MWGVYEVSPLSVLGFPQKRSEGYSGSPEEMGSALGCSDGRWGLSFSSKGAGTASALQGSGEESHTEAWCLGTGRPCDAVQREAQGGG